MRKKKGFTLIELLVVIAIIAMLLAILMPALSKVKKIAQRVVCATNLKGLGTAQTVYSNDYDDEYTVQGQGGAHIWSNVTDAWNVVAKNWKTTPQNITVGASLFLLVREADVSPKSFVCPASTQQVWDGRTAAAGATTTPDIVEVWDFGGVGFGGQGPQNCVSYSYHQPYVAGSGTGTSTGSKNRYSADGSRSASFATMADRNPYFDKSLTFGGVTQENYVDRSRLLNYLDTAQKWELEAANAAPHDREGQNVTFADGHATYETRADIGIRFDEIYTQWSGTGSSEADRRTGTGTAGAGLTFFPMGSEDSVLVNDGSI